MTQVFINGARDEPNVREFESLGTKFGAIIINHPNASLPPQILRFRSSSWQPPRPGSRPTVPTVTLPWELPCGPAMAQYIPVAT